ncbi:plasmid pRiA4b ORF-3 family protein [Agrobacterium sp. rho-13.3]|uniref:plasmid pRiA4b ORF-3 family protein n=1 Tax=Agrobacterium sp. rho-13.3 TaxID=3072980 RepID=UPI002A1363C8|nr:plasmid pRiA4b ORF-3 family protein [Agrobacterium sp. rho-13.3]MDX8306201.1 plasmid pRiA4b ORF-3 family protein [Agrobacterium sp. rho-13.3]MDX8307468.1 plasmid pRiA4b ORF-3 family protein [Agrobacterium sp. rho-13.3]
MSSGKIYTAARVAARLNKAEMARLCALPVSIIRALEAGKDQDSKIAVQRTLATRSVTVYEDDQLVTFPKQSKNDFGYVISVARAGAGISQADLATFSGVSLRSINGTEGGSVLSTTAVQDAIVACLARRGVEITLERNDRWGVHIVNAQDVQPGERRFPNGESPFEIAMDRMKQQASNPHIPEMLRLRIELTGTRPLIWREILIPENATFADLHCTIQTIFGWRWAHLHEFHCGLTIGNIKELSGGSISDSQAIDERLIALNQVHDLFPKFQYLYDFGDNWTHLIKVADKIPRLDRPVRPVLVDGSGGFIVENSGGSKHWNDLATALRKGKADAGTLDWLQQCGYGRNFDPDALDIDGINEALLSTDFDIPATWHDEWDRRQNVKITAQHLREEYPRPTIQSRYPSNGVTVIAVEDFTEEDFDRDWISDVIDGMAFTQSTKMGKTVPVRSLLADISPFLDFSGDVVSFRSFPKAFRWKDDKRAGVFHPDLAIAPKRGKEVLVHFALSEEEADFVKRLSKQTRVKIHLFGGGIVDDQIARNCYELRRLSRGVRDEIDDVRAALKEQDLSKGISMTGAVRLLISKGVTELSGFTGRSPEHRAKSRIATAVAQKAIGINMKVPFDITRIGEPGLTAETCQFWETAELYRL